MKIGVLVSREGSNLYAMHQSEIRPGLVLADRRCKALVKAQRLQLPAELVLRTDYTEAFEAEREVFTRKVLYVLKLYGIELVVMAGYMTLLSPIFFEYYKDRVLGIHPSLLPRHKGKDAVKQTLEAGDLTTGSTVYVATAKLDEGRISLQSHVIVQPGDTVETLTERIKKAEARLYPPAIKQYIREITSLQPAR